MSVIYLNSTRPGPSQDQPNLKTSKPVYYQYQYGSWQDYNCFSFGGGNEPQVLAVNGYANANADIALQGAAPADHASIQISLANVANLNGFSSAGGTGTVTSSAASQGLLTLTHGCLSGTYSASLSIEIIAYLPAEKASIDLRVTDSFQLRLSGTGYVGAALTQTSASGGTVQAITPNAAGANAPARPSCATFDLARFAASVLGTGQIGVTFIASAPGESLQGFGSSVLTIDAVAQFAGAHQSNTARFCDTERSTVAFNDNSPPVAGCYNPHGAGPSPLNMFQLG